MEKVTNNIREESMYNQSIFTMFTSWSNAELIKERFKLYTIVCMVSSTINNKSSDEF